MAVARKKYLSPGGVAPLPVTSYFFSLVVFLHSIKYFKNLFCISKKNALADSKALSGTGATGRKLAATPALTHGTRWLSTRWSGHPQGPMCPRDDQKARAGKDRKDVATGKFPLPAGTKKADREIPRPALRCCEKKYGLRPRYLPLDRTSAAVIRYPDTPGQPDTMSAFKKSEPPAKRVVCSGPIRAYYRLRLKTLAFTLFKPSALAALTTP